MATLAAPTTAIPSTPRAAIGAAVAVGAIATAATAAGLGHEAARPDASSVLRGALVASYTLVGAFTWWRRPSSKLGVRLTQIGLVYAVAGLAASDVALVHSTGRVVHAAWIVALAYVFLCFPGDRLGTAVERRLFAALAVSMAVVWAVTIPVVDRLPPAGPLVDCSDNCPENAFQVVPSSETATAALSLGINALTGASLIAVAVVLLRKASSPIRPRRRLIAPVLACAAVLAVCYTAYTILRELDLDAGLVAIPTALAGLAIPFAILVGQVRGHIFAAARIGSLVSRVDTKPVTPQQVQRLLRDVLGDPMLSIAFATPDRRWIDVTGRPIDLGAPSEGYAITYVHTNGHVVMALVHDALIGADEALIEGVGATALMLLDNARLVDELRASRARIVASAQRERLRLERNLHDGAQQRLFAVQVRLQGARSGADADLARELDEIADMVTDAVEELRSLAHGLYPTLLRERGLADALRGVAQSSGMPITVTADNDGRLPHEIEEAVYFSILEAIQNVAKHAGPGAHTTVTLDRTDEELAFTVVDDGPGFEPRGPSDGVGLASMRDRIGAIGGTIEIHSAPGRGTSVLGRIPCVAER